MIVSRIFVPLLGVFALVQFSWAQASREELGAGGGPTAEAVAPGPAGPQGEQVKRSDLWMAVHMQYRESAGEAEMGQRRLTPEERLQLRDQVRRAAGKVDAGNRVRGEQFAPPGMASTGR